MNGSAYFAINYECNNNCLFCPNRSDKYKGALDFVEFKKSLDTMMSKSSLTHITISGGEPTLNKDFIRIMKYVTEMGVSVLLFSNSIKFSDEDFIEEFAYTINPKKIMISSPIHSCEQYIHDSTTQIPGSFEKTVQGIKNLINKNYTVSIKNCINKLNYRQLDEYINFVINEFPSVRNIGLYGLDYCGTNDEKNKKVKVKFSEIAPYLEKALENFGKKKSKHKVTVYDTPLCIVKPKYWKYFSDNKFKISSARSSPDTRISENGKVEFSIPNQCGTFSLKCKECIAEDCCQGTWKSSWELLGDQDIKSIVYNG